MAMINTERGTGRTTRQMLSAPKNAYYFAPGRCMGDMAVWHRQAVALGRHDLSILPEAYLDDWAARMGGDMDFVVFDHAIDLNKSPKRAQNVAHVQWAVELHVQRVIQRLKRSSDRALHQMEA